MLDRDAANQFDGANTYGQRYYTSWPVHTSDDTYIHDIEAGAHARIKEKIFDIAVRPLAPLAMAYRL